MSTTLDLANIQGDVLEGLPKKYESFIFFAIADATQFRQRLKGIIPLITTTVQALADMEAIKEHKAKGYKDLLKLVGTNIAFSHTGLYALGIDDAPLGDPLFSKGQLADASAGAAGLSDPGPIVGSGSTAGTDPAWDHDFKKQIDGCILITGESKQTISERLEQILTKLAGTFKIIKEVHGNVRPGAESGHEHFGFNDGLSQPQIIGFNTSTTGGQSTEPGLILIGENGDTPLSKVTRPAWAKDSSFLVFRKLKQLVPEFNKFLAENPIPDKNLPPKQGSELLGARLVGRWKSGASIDLDPTADKPADAHNNNFDYRDDLTAQTRCPFTAHLRKTNPRASNVPSLPIVQENFRIIRQGIAYGPEVYEDETESQTSKHDRGLLFVCYQSDIGKGFHFIQRTWANNIDFPNTGAGYDGIIGQDIHNQRTTTGMDPQNVSTSLALPKQAFVVPLGGEYFLSPSISALKTIFAA